MIEINLVILLSAVIIVALFTEFMRELFYQRRVRMMEMSREIALERDMSPVMPSLGVGALQTH